MAKFEVGHPKVGGRVKGTPNKIDAVLKEVQMKILNAMNTLDVQAILYQLASENPKALVALLSKTIPNKVELTGGEDENGARPLTIEIRGYVDKNNNNENSNT